MRILFIRNRTYFLCCFTWKLWFAKKWRYLMSLLWKVSGFSKARLSPINAFFLIKHNKATFAAECRTHHYRYLNIYWNVTVIWQENKHIFVKTANLKMEFQQHNNCGTRCRSDLEWYLDSCELFQLKLGKMIQTTDCKPSSMPNCYICFKLITLLHF